MSSGDAVRENGVVENGLSIAIIGAGIGGLSAACFLRQQGHNVQVYESSKFATELGAAIHIPPNACSLLNRLGIVPSDIGANPCARISTWSSNGHKLSSVETSRSAGLWTHPWTLGHRVRLHTALKEAAIKSGISLALAKPAVDVDVDQGIIQFQDGTTTQADVVLGADGVHSICRSKVAASDKGRPRSSGKSAFRFLIPRKLIIEDPQTRPYAEVDGELLMVFHRDRRLVMYPTNDNTLLNFVCIHPEGETAAASSGDWNNKATKEMLLEVYKDFHIDFQAILSKVDESSLKIWRLLDMDRLSTWTSGKLGLLGDAAHPFLPHQGQGGAVAIEDAAALGVVLDRQTKPEEVPDRLQLYQTIRQGRADKLQQYTRLAGQDLEAGEQSPINMFEFITYNFGHDEHDNATQKLREWKWNRQPESYWRMPVAFGPMPGPRQTHHGMPWDGTKSRFITASIKIKTSRTVLQNLFPPRSTGWKFTSPGTVAYCTFSQTTLSNLNWLGGRGYNHLGLYIHGTAHTDDSGRTIGGTYLPVLFEDLADPIISGREELGMPKVFSTIDVTRSPSTYRIDASWQGSRWGSFVWEDLQPIANETAAVNGASQAENQEEGILFQKYVPKVGREFKNQSDAEYTVCAPFKGDRLVPKTERTLVTKNASFALDAQDWKAFPTLHHIISRLAEIPVHEIVEAKVVEGTGVSDVSSAFAVGM